MEKLNLLAELDELVLRTRDRNSREYIYEAVQAYRAGLSRSAIVNTWTALVYDIVVKIRELAVQGDVGASTFVTSLDNAIKGRNVVQLQKIESDILEVARNDFEFISDREKVELDRLREDRHMCAHPAFTGDTVLFIPSAEQVRVHIVHAVEHVLKHPPVQGRAAITRLSADILRASFPIEQDKVNAFLNDRYLNRAKSTLLGQMISAILSVLLRGSDPSLFAKSESLARCLVSIALAAPTEYERLMREQMLRRTDGMDDSFLFSILLLCQFDKRCWNWTDRATQVRVTTLISNVPFSINAWGWVAYAFNIDELKDVARIRFEQLQPAEKESAIVHYPRVEFAAFAIGLLAEAGGWRRAEHIGRQMIIPMAPHFTPMNIGSVLAAVSSTSQAWDASGMPEIICEMFEITKQSIRECTNAWQTFATFVSNTDAEYQELLQKMTLSGIWPVT
ncbi:MAG: hypothetical protein ACK5OC_25605 [Pirellula sp.]|jgi:hypothetical protein